MDKFTHYVAVAALLASAMCPQLIARTKNAPLPEQILLARTVCVLNPTKIASLSDKAFAELTKWGRFKVDQKPEDADLVLVLSTRARVTTVDTGPADPFGTSGGFADFGIARLSAKIHYDCITVFDRETNRLLWSHSKQLGFFTRNPIGSLVKELRKTIAGQEAQA